MEPRFVVVKI